MVTARETATAFQTFQIMLSPASQKDAAYAAMLQEADAVMSREVMLALSYQGSIPQGVLPFMKKIGLLGG